MIGKADQWRSFVDILVAKLYDNVYGKVSDFDKRNQERRHQTMTYTIHAYLVLSKELCKDICSLSPNCAL